MKETLANGQQEKIIKNVVTRPNLENALKKFNDENKQEEGKK